MQEQNNIVLYRDDGLGMMVSEIWYDPILTEKKKNKSLKYLKALDHLSQDQLRYKSAKCIDDKFDLTKYIYKPYRKPNDGPVYVNKRFNHPLNIQQQTPLSVRSKF